jgi:hypothetical protein
MAVENVMLVNDGIVTKTLTTIQDLKSANSNRLKMQQRLPHR